MTMTTRAPVAPPAPTRRQPGGGASAARPSAGDAPTPMPVAPVGRRVAAFLVDLVVTALVVAGVYLGTEEVLYAALALVEVPVALCVWEARSGLTVGNALLGIRTVRADGPFAPGIGRSVVRGLVVLAGFLVAAVGQFVVVASGAWDRSPLKQGWHDALARTTMIDVSRRSSSRRARNRADRAGDAPGAAGQPVFHAPLVSAPGVTSGRADLELPVTPVAPAETARAVPAGVSAVQPAAPLVPPPAPAAPPHPAAPARPAAPAHSVAPAHPLAPAPPSPVVPAAAQALPQALSTWAPPPRRLASPDQGVPVAAPAAAHLAGPPAAPATRAATGAYLLSFDNGQSFTVHGSGLVGRKPQSAPGEQHDALLAVDDENRSLSKTHLEFGIDEGGFWVTDRGSTNGTSVLTAHGEPLDVLVGVRIHVPADGSVRVGRRQFTARPLAR